MKAHKWAARIVGAGLLFVGAIWAMAPAHATDVVEHQSDPEIRTFVEKEAACYSLALAAENSYQMERHTFNLKQFFDDYSYVITYTIGYTDGYLKAVSYMTKQPAKFLADKRHTAICLESA